MLSFYCFTIFYILFHILKHIKLSLVQQSMKNETEGDDMVKGKETEIKKPHKSIKIEFNENTLWKSGTFIFGILFVISLITGGFGSGSENTVQAAPNVPSPTPTQQAPIPDAPVNIQVADAYFKGDKNAPVEIIEFSDFQCPFCKRFYDQTFDQIMKTYVDTGKAVFAYKHLPLGFHENAQKAGEAAECAGKIGGSDMFWGMHDKIFENQQAITPQDLKKYAGELGLNQKNFDTCLDNDETAAKVQTHSAEASKLGVTGTPTFFINGKKIVGAQPYQAFEVAIEAELN